VERRGWKSYGGIGVLLQAGGGTPREAGGGHRRKTQNEERKVDATSLDKVGGKKKAD